MPADRPNLFIIHTDQQSWWTLGCYGGSVVETPNIDGLAANGTLFTNFFANSALCTPSRGCFVTGRYPECNGAYANNIELNRNEITFAEVLRQNGYRTGYAGKWHLDGRPRPGWVHPDRTMGFDEAAYIEDVLYKTIRPMLTMNPRCIVIALSSPNGRDGWYYRASESERWLRVVVKAPWDLNE